MPPLPAETHAARGLERLIGLADSPVLQRRLRHTAPLLAMAGAETLSHPDLADPLWAALIDAVTVQETRLFRVPRQWEDLAALVLPGLAGLGRPLRLLSAGCATGEEPWSLAALAAGAGLPAAVLGVDLCRPALARAATGLFPPGPPDPLRDVPAAYRPFFAPAEGGVRACPGPRVSVRFRRANLLDPAAWIPEDLPPFDIVLCRNVLIYLTPGARQAVLERLRAQLAPGGALLLGPTDRPPPGLGLRLWSADQTCLWRA